MSAAVSYETYDLETLKKFKSFLDAQSKELEKAIEAKTPGPKPIPFEIFCKSYIPSFPRYHPYCKKLYAFYKDVYMGHDKEFELLIERWDGMYTIQQFKKVFGHYLKTERNANEEDIVKQYKIMLIIGKGIYKSKLKIELCKRIGLQEFRNSYWFLKFGKVTKIEKKFIKSPSADLTNPISEFRGFEGYDEREDCDVLDDEDDEDDDDDHDGMTFPPPHLAGGDWFADMNEEEEEKLPTTLKRSEVDCVLNVKGIRYAFNRETGACWTRNKDTSIGKWVGIFDQNTGKIDTSTPEITLVDE